MRILLAQKGPGAYSKPSHVTRKLKNYFDFFLLNIEQLCKGSFEPWPNFTFQDSKTLRVRCWQVASHHHHASGYARGTSGGIFNHWPTDCKGHEQGRWGHDQRGGAHRCRLWCRQCTGPRLLARVFEALAIAKSNRIHLWMKFSLELCILPWVLPISAPKSSTAGSAGDFKPTRQVCRGTRLYS